MTELEFLKLLLDNWPWAKTPAVEAFIAKASVSLNHNDPIDRKEGFTLRLYSSLNHVFMILMRVVNR